MTSQWIENTFIGSAKPHTNARIASSWKGTLSPMLKIGKKLEGYNHQTCIQYVETFMNFDSANYKKSCIFKLLCFVNRALKVLRY